MRRHISPKSIPNIASGTSQKNQTGTFAEEQSTAPTPATGAEKIVLQRSFVQRSESKNFRIALDFFGPDFSAGLAAAFTVAAGVGAGVVPASGFDIGKDLQVRNPDGGLVQKLYHLSTFCHSVSFSIKACTASPFPAAT
jgi:hypothetical protein